MSLFKKLLNCRTEEDVKDAYITALKLKGVHKSLIDIQTDEIWFEAKEGGKISTYAMFTQLLHYVQQALDHGEQLPKFLCVIDSVKAALMETKLAIPLLEKRTIKWGKSASQFPLEALEVVSQYIGTHFVSFRMDTHEKEFIEAVNTAIKSGEIIRTQITPDNLKQVFDKWVTMIGEEIDGAIKDDYALLFFADIMSDGSVSTHENMTAELLHRGTKPLFSLRGNNYELKSHEGYRQFWAIYHRPPKEEYRNYLLERRDSLIPLDKRGFKGAYYTPLHVVEKSYDLLTQTLGSNWQREYLIWDMCCGVGNLETKHSNPRNVYMSTLDQEDVDVMNAARTCVQAERFQYDYLNDDVTDSGDIDYALTRKVPKKLQDAIKSGKKILILINPPYAEATNADNTVRGATAGNKPGVAKTKWASVGMANYGKASNELFTQFVSRIAKEIPQATLAMFSTLKYVNAPNFEKFREVWNAQYLGGFIVHSKAFDGLTGDFPIGFCVWQTDQQAEVKTPINEISTEVLDKSAQPIGEKKFYNIPTEQYLNKWIARPRANQQEVVPLSNIFTPTTGNPRVKTWSEGALAYMCAGTNDLQNASNFVYLMSSPASRGNGLYVNEQNLWQVAILFTVCRSIKHTWINDRDQFLQPSVELPSTFINDCLIWMLFNGKNLTAGAAGLQWDNKQWNLVNHFIPFTEAEVNATGRFESDFMVNYLADKEFSGEAQAVLDAGRKLWQAYFSRTDNKATRDKFMLNRPDVGWYQIRGTLKARNELSDGPPISFAEFESTYSLLSDKLRPMVYELGFLKSFLPFRK